MDILLISAIIFVTLVALGYPLINSRKYAHARRLRDDTPLETLENARVQTLDAIRDLQFDHMTGKLSQTDYQSLRTQYEFKAAQILQQLDTIEGRPKTAVQESKSCPRCKTSIDGLDKFCIRCGTKIQ